MKRFMRGLLAIVVALTFISCATLGDTTRTHEGLTIEDGEVDHSDDFHFGWNYVFPFEGNDQYYSIIMAQLPCHIFRLDVQ